MRKNIFLFIAVMEYSAFAQINSGSVLVFSISKDQLIVATDSRTVDNDGRRPPNDLECKISTFNHQVIFTSIGGKSYSPTDHDFVAGWDNYDVAHSVVQSARGEPSEAHIRDVVHRWAEIIKVNWRSLYAWNPAKVIDAAEHGKGGLTSGVFAEGRAGKGYMLGAQITFHRNSIEPIEVVMGSPTNCLPCEQREATKICIGGEDEVAAEFCSQHTERAKNEGWNRWNISPSLMKAFNKTELWPIRLADLTVAYDIHGDVGGRIDAVEFKPDGSIRWLQRKDNCPENED